MISLHAANPIPCWQFECSSDGSAAAALWQCGPRLEAPLPPPLPPPAQSCCCSKARSAFQLRQLEEPEQSADASARGTPRCSGSNSSAVSSLLACVARAVSGISGNAVEGLRAALLPWPSLPGLLRRGAAWPRPAAVAPWTHAASCARRPVLLGGLRSAGAVPGLCAHALAPAWAEGIRSLCLGEEMAQYRLALLC